MMYHKNCQGENSLAVLPSSKLTEELKNLAVHFRRL